MRVSEQAVRSDVYDDEMFQAETDVEDVHEEVMADTGDSGAQAPMDESRRPLTPDELKTIVDHELVQAGMHSDSELVENRIAAYRYYDGNLKRAPKGRSQAVSTDVADVIEWTLPQVMASLFGTENVVKFCPDSEEDEDQAQLETDACEFVLMQENQGWLKLQTAIRDALLLRNGVLKVYQSDRVQVRLESYEGLTEGELMALLDPEDSNTEFDVIGHDAYEGPPLAETLNPVELMQAQQAIASGVAPPSYLEQPTQLYDVKVRVRETGGQTIVRPVPLDQFGVNPDHDDIDLQPARFTFEQRRVPRFQLVEEGFDYDMVMALPPSSEDHEGEAEERRRSEDEGGFDYEHLDDSMRLVDHFECYIRIDADRDGYAEILKVDVGGDQGSSVLMGIEETDHNPFVGGTGILQPHKFVGRSLFDRIWEIADQKTRVVRALQDNLEHQNNARNAVVVGQVNIDDMMTSRPGGVVRVKAPGMIDSLVAPQIGEWGYRHLDWLDQVRTGRAGVSPDTANIAEAIAGDTAHGLERIMSAKEELTGLIVKMLAETLFAGAMRLIRMNLQKYRTSAMHFKKRGKWVEVDPREWKTRTRVEVETHLSQGDKSKRAVALGQLLEQQAMVAEKSPGLVTPKNAYSALAAFARATPIGDPSPFWTDPESPEGQKWQAELDKQREEQMAGEMAAQDKLLGLQNHIAQMDEETKRLKMRLEAHGDQQKLLADMQKAMEELRAKYTEMELKYNADVPGKGIEGGADAAGAKGERSTRETIEGFSEN